MKYLVRLLSAVFLLLAGTVAAGAETTFIVEYNPDPCREIAVVAKDKTAQVGKVTISLEPFYYAACERVRTSIVDSINARVEALRGDLEAEAQARVAPLYDGFWKWLSLEVYDRLPEADKAQIKPEEHFQEWLQHPDQELSTYVNYYMKTHLPEVTAALELYQKDTSGEIVDGLQALWDGAKKKLDALNQTYEELDTSPPDTEYTDILRNNGLSGQWIDRLENYEGQFNLLDKNYNIVDTAYLIKDAFTAEEYSGRLEGMFTLMEKFGGFLADSSVPGVSLLGTLVEAYGQMAKEILARANELKKLIRAREGFCIGMATHTLLDERSKALEALAGAGVQACPLDEKKPLLKDVYVQTDPQNADQLFFWINGGFVKGREGGGGEEGLRRARVFIEDAAGIGFAEYVGKSGDMKTVVSVYNTPYGPDYYLADLPNHSPSPGLPGLVAEADAVFEAIVRRVRELRGHLQLDESCTEDAFSQLVRSETGLRLAAFPLEDRAALGKLKTSYALGFIQLHAASGTSLRTASYKRYSEVWQKLKFLSLVRLEGRVLDKNNASAPCEKCAGAAISLDITDGREIPACRVNEADANGRFVARIVTRSVSVTITPRASVDSINSDPVTIDARHLTLEGATPPFLRSFDVNLFMPFQEEATGFEDALNVLWGLHGEAQQSADEGRAACTASRIAVATAEKQTTNLENKISELRDDIAKIGSGASLLDDAKDRADKIAAKGEAAAQKTVEAKEQAEKGALSACDMAAQMRNETDKSKQQNLLRKIRATATGVTDKARVASTSFDESRNAAQSVEKLADEVRSAAEAVSGAHRKFASIGTLSSDIEAALGEMSTHAEVLKQAVENGRDILLRAESAHDTAVAAAQSTENPGEATGRANRLFDAIKAIVGEQSACLDDLEAAREKVEKSGLAAAVEELASAVKALLGESDARSVLTAVRAQAASTRAGADVAEIFFEAAQSAEADANRCQKLGEAAGTEDRSDDQAAAAEAAISQCRFDDAWRLIQNLAGTPRYAALASAHKAAVQREAQTKAAYGRADSAYKACNYDEALTALDKAYQGTSCDRYRVRIDQARQKVASAAGREETTKTLFNEAKRLFNDKKYEAALAKLNAAKANTDCDRYGPQIDAAIAKVESAMNTVATGDDDGAAAENGGAPVDGGGEPVAGTASELVGVWAFTPNACSGKAPPPKKTDKSDSSGGIGEAIVGGVVDAIEQALKSARFRFAENGDFIAIGLKGETKVMGTWQLVGDTITTIVDGKPNGATIVERYPDRIVFRNASSEEKITMYRCASVSDTGGDANEGSNNEGDNRSAKAIANVCGDSSVPVDGSLTGYNRLYGGGQSSIMMKGDYACTGRDSYWQVNGSAITQYRCEADYTNCKQTKVMPVIKTESKDGNLVYWTSDSDWWVRTGSGAN